MNISSLLKDVLRRKIAIKTAMNDLETQLLQLKQELLQILPETIPNQNRKPDSDIELESYELRSTLYLMKQLNELFSESENLSKQNALAFSNTNITELKNQLNEIQDATQQIMLKSDIAKIRYKYTLENLARLLLRLEEEGDIEHVPPRVVASYFLVDSKEVNPRSYSQCFYRVKLSREEAKQSNGLLLNKDMNR